ncbi:hypothetical protein A1O3_02111 [Capronia epimyces CBS 606.96]|uniref:Polyprenal reductase n=1 Tax=Capronia epimyces CBS 606.96 TaxID=1182542 RepID=W9Y873_9EURO|nr:uncharacterized protein A1O3_02111 [Capronia epimyces CBS 606.96]EXJ89047.1 hypothetical protein A1O3_02111 [Capronia epimyces CBS 606.96]
MREMLGPLVWAIRGFYLLSGIAILTVRSTPSLRDRFLAYGARDHASDDARTRDTKKPPLGIQLLDFVASLKVPHSWFTHFYVVSVVSSLCCMYTFGDRRTEAVLEIPSFCSALMLLQGCRRLLECVVLTRPGQSRMWIGHYAIGFAFYVVTNIAIWAEHLGSANTTLHGHEGYWQSLWAPRVLTCTLLFVYASYKQHSYHGYLARLKKYTLPDVEAFRSIVAPHYTAECGIYLALAVLGAPQGHGRTSFVNWTLFCALIFVAVNLGVTADGTRSWMMDKFPERKEDIRRRWRMIPGLW